MKRLHFKMGCTCKGRNGDATKRNNSNNWSEKRATFITDFRAEKIFFHLAFQNYNFLWELFLCRIIFLYLLHLKQFNVGIMNVWTNVKTVYMVSHRIGYNFSTFEWLWYKLCTDQLNFHIGGVSSEVEPQLTYFVHRKKINMNDSLNICWNTF